MDSETAEIRKILMVEMSRRNTDAVAEVIYDKPYLFTNLIDIFLLNEEPISRRAVWVIDTVSEKLPTLLEPYISSIVVMLPRFNHDGLKRNSLRMLSRATIPDDCLGQLMEVCFNWLVSRNESIAVKVYAMDILYSISQKHFEIKKELIDSISWRIEEESAGFKAHASKILISLNKELL